MSTARTGGEDPDPAPALGEFELFADTDPGDLAELRSRLEPVSFAAGSPVLQAGDPGDFFLLLDAGEVAVVLPEDAAHEPIALGPGEMVGELSILRGSPRVASVVATTDVRALRGDRDAFAVLLGLPGTSERLRRTAAGRLATNAEPVEVVLRDGTPVWLRPVLPTDWPLMRDALEHVSPEFFRQRFFSGGRPPDSMLHYLVDIDYSNHFAWAAFVVGPDGEEAIGSARYICRRDDPGSAEIALGVIDEYQGRGLGVLLLGALATAAPAIGVERFFALTNTDNAPMRGLLSRFGAAWDHEEPGVLSTEIDVGLLDDVLPSPERDALARVAANVIATAHRTAI